MILSRFNDVCKNPDPMSNKRKSKNNNLRSKKRAKIEDNESDLDNEIEIDTGVMINFRRNLEDDIDDWNEWVSATDTRNYLLNDGLLDVLKYKGSTLTKVKSSYQDTFIKTIGNNDESFISSLMQQGIKFEKRVISLIIDKIGTENVINIGGDLNPRSRSNYLKTLKAINDGIPVIYQGIVRNYKNKTYGIPDLLVRSDWLSEIYTQVNYKPYEIKKDKSKSKGKGKGKDKIKGKDSDYHYVVIDIKFKTLNLKADGLHLLNDGPIKAYKAQLCVYNQALGEMQGYLASTAFIMGWKWKYTSMGREYRGNNCFDRLGLISYIGSDKEYAIETKKAIDWINKVRQESHTWDLSKLPLPCDELYPNMCNRYDYPYHTIKKKFAEDIKEITMIWKCGVKHRREAHQNGIYSWDDIRCTPQALGIGGDFTTTIVNKILEANNRSESNIVPRYIKNNYDDWKNRKQLEFFVDFEMTCSVFTEFDDLPNSGGESLIFVIGIGHIDTDTGEWIFKDFTVDTLDNRGESIICEQFCNYITSLQRKYGCFEDPFLYHWSPAEPSAWKRVVRKHSQLKSDLVWSDMLKLFHEEPIGIKGCLNYSLKTVAKAFYKHGYIKTTWDTGSSCSDGAGAALGAYKIDKETRKMGVSFKSSPLTEEIIKYNEVDCRVLQEILYYLRDNHIDPNDPDIEDIEDIDIIDDLMDISTIEMDINSDENINDVPFLDFNFSSEDDSSFEPDDDSDSFDEFFNYY
jgi:hypothetical protein